MSNQNKRRVVITGVGIISDIGNTAEDVLTSLKLGQSGIRHMEEYASLNFRSQVAGPIDVDLESLIDRRHMRFMKEGIGYGYLAMKQAVEDAHLSEEMLSSPKTGMIIGAGGTSTQAVVRAADIVRQTGSPRKIGPFVVPQAMNSGGVANLSTLFKTKGVSYSISSACATSTHCVGHAYQLVNSGFQDIVLAGGIEELDWALSSLFDAMGALSSHYNQQPEKASRPFDANRDGFVIAGGAGVVILETLEHARARGAPHIYGEIVGYGITSDGCDMVQPSGEGAMRCMRMALEEAGHIPIDYINAHGTSTPVGDLKEIEAIREVFGAHIPPISSTKALTGHSLGATGVQEVIFSLLMMRHNFMCASHNIETLDPALQDVPILRENRTGTFNSFLTNSFGFGGTNGSLVVQRFEA